MYYHMHGDYQHWSEDKYPHTSDKDIEKHEKWCCKNSTYSQLSTMTTFLLWSYLHLQNAGLHLDHGETLLLEPKASLQAPTGSLLAPCRTLDLP